MSDRRNLRLFASNHKRCSDRRYVSPGARRLGFESLERRTLLAVGAVPAAAGVVNLSANAGNDIAAVMDDGQVAWYNEDGLYFHDGIATTRVDKPSSFYQIDAGNLVWFGPTSEMAAGIFLYDGTDTRLLGETASPFFQADEGNVAWMGIDGLYLYNGTTTTRLGSPTPSYQLEGGQVVWFEPDEGDPGDPADDTSNVYFFDGTTTHTLTNNGILPPYETSGMGGAPGTLIDEGKVVWLELASEENTEVRLYDSATEQTKILGLGMFPQIEDGQVAWMHAVEAQT
ncbi:MAG: hypothetical protein V3R99_00670, partial [Thermoguttaceae bacterium]